MAQLVARLVRNEKVRGSSPLSSTICNMALTRSFVLLADVQDCSSFVACAPGVAVLGFSASASRLESQGCFTSSQLSRGPRMRLAA